MADAAIYSCCYCFAAVAADTAVATAVARKAVIATTFFCFTFLCAAAAAEINAAANSYINGTRTIDETLALKNLSASVFVIRR